ncbi:EmrB/QacA subfamily drug resistance transporter [Kutzneria viridogrisea]|uniref:EmrB/QacA subfamily drug resistance transporter n=1 Tax=Kutzneria viridogrisea TaxID=47990 RepID=A0ABR6BK30_9PSEU|nr:MFS transporter [Kutzneria albida]MBA8927021.1 EmrB/QacA subfamily drug resistance transporter [Kutzneria viridogrisea]
MLGVAVLAQTLVSMDSSVLNIAVKTLADPVSGLGASPDQLAWAINAYTVVFASAMFAGGALADRFGQRRALVAGLLLFSVTSALAAFASTPVQLVLARGAMGLGGALLMPATLAIVIMASRPEQRSRAIAIWASAAAVGLAIGPVAGGALLGWFWWGSVFLINVPIVLLCLVGIALWVPEYRADRPRPLDPLGLVLSFAGLGGVVFGVINAGQDWLRLDVLGPILVGLALLGAFAVAQLRAAEPSFDVRLFTRRRFAGGSLSLMIAFFGVSGQLFYATFYLQDVRGLSPLAAGLATAPTALGIVLGNLVAPGLVARWSTRWVAAVGMAVSIATFGSYVLFDQHTPIAWYAAMMLVQGAAMGLVAVPSTAASMAALPPERSGAGSAVTSAMRQVGSALGVAVVGSLLTSSYRAAAGSWTGASFTDGAAYLHAMAFAAGWTCLLCLAGLALIVVCLNEN